MIVIGETSKQLTILSCPVQMVLILPWLVLQTFYASAFINETVPSRIAANHQHSRP